MGSAWHKKGEKRTRDTRGDTIPISSARRSAQQPLVERSRGSFAGAAAPAPAGGTGAGKAPSTYDPSAPAAPAIPAATAPAAPGFDYKGVDDGMAGTCELQEKNQHKCKDDMDTAGAIDGTNHTMMNLMFDGEQMESCGYADMQTIVNGLLKWAYKSKCGLDGYTISRACIGQAGTPADGYWRARVMLWPKTGSTDPICTPVCVKMRGQQNLVTHYGRTGTCTL